MRAEAINKKANQGAQDVESDLEVVVQRTFIHFPLSRFDVAPLRRRSASAPPACHSRQEIASCGKADIAALIEEAMAAPRSCASRGKAHSAVEIKGMVDMSDMVDIDERDFWSGSQAGSQGSSGPELSSGCPRTGAYRPWRRSTRGGAGRRRSGGDAGKLGRPHVSASTQLADKALKGNAGENARGQGRSSQNGRWAQYYSSHCDSLDYATIAASSMVSAW